MKRILYFMVAGLMAFTATSQSTVQCPSPEAISAMDSLSILFGDVYGIGMGQQLHEAEDVVIDIDQVVKGIEYVVNGDDDKDFIVGISTGVYIIDTFNKIKNDCGSPINKPLFFEQLKEGLLAETPADEADMETLDNHINEFFGQIQSGGGNRSLMDSLSVSLGYMYGAMTRDRLFDEELQNLDLEKTFRGIEYIANTEGDESYNVGLLLGYQVVNLFPYIQEQVRMPLNQDLFMEHLRSGLRVETFDEEATMALQEKIEPLMNRAVALSPDAIANKKAGEAYMEGLRKDKSFKFTKSGLAYKMLKKGKGKKFTEEDVVNTIYVAKHLDGTVFDSSDGEPILLSVHQVIPGFAEMLQLMKPGSKAIVVIPGELGYGNWGMNIVGPNETLIFEVETVGAK